MKPRQIMFKSLRDAQGVASGINAVAGQGTYHVDYGNIPSPAGSFFDAGYVVTDAPMAIVKRAAKMHMVDVPQRAAKAVRARKGFRKPFSVDVWEERDNLQITLEDADGKTVAQWVDDDARQMFEDGFFDRRRLAASVIEYAEQMGIGATAARGGGRPRRSGGGRGHNVTANPVRRNPPHRGYGVTAGGKRIVGTLGTPLEIKYKHAADGKFYKHEFSRTAKLVVYADGTVGIVGGGKAMWGDF